MSVNFFTETINFRWKEKRKLTLWIDKVIQKHHFILKNLNIILCHDDYLYKMNKQFLKHNTLTDVITFDLSDEKNVINGEIYISLTRVKENAKIFNVKTDRELKRVIIHGVLHLIGYKDKSPRDEKKMREKEADCLKLLK